MSHRNLHATLRRICIAAALIALPIAAPAQTQGISAAAMGSPDGVVVLIAGPALHPSAAGANDGWIGYNVWRKADGEADFRKMNPAPLSRPASNSAWRRSFNCW